MEGIQLQPMADVLRSAWEHALDFCLPRRCLFCLAPLEEETGALCQHCEAALPATGEDALRSGLHFQRCLSPLLYTDGVKESFHRYKFGGRWHYSRIFGQWMWECLNRYEPGWERFDALTWVPLSRRRYLRRGYDQSKRLAQAVARHSALSLRPMLEKCRHISELSATQSAAQRWEKVQGVYRLRKGVSVEGKRILLIDDIITTGATLEEAAGVLQKGGAAEVCCLTLARTPPKTR